MCSKIWYPQTVYGHDKQLCSYIMVEVDMQLLHRSDNKLEETLFCFINNLRGSWPRPLPWRPITARQSVMIQTGDSFRGFEWLKCTDAQMFCGYYLQMFLLCKVIGYYLPRSWLSGGQVIWTSQDTEAHQNKLVSLMATTACMGQQFILAIRHTPLEI